MPSFPKLNLARAVKIPTDVLSIDSINANENNQNNDGRQSTSIEKEDNVSKDIPVTESPPSPFYSIDKSDLNNDISNSGQLQNHQGFNENDRIIQPYVSDCESEPSSIVIQASPRPEVSSVISDEDTIGNPIGPDSPGQLFLPPVKKRRRTVNRINQDPETMALRDLLFYNPPETIFQKENRESHELKQPQKNKAIESATIGRRRSSSRCSSVSSDQSSKDKVQQQISSTGSAPYSASVDDQNVSSTIQETKPQTSEISSGEQMLTIDESGNIVFKNPDQISSDKKEEPKHNTIVQANHTTYASFSRRERKNNWTSEETRIFYTALEIVGTDFSLMEAVYFKDRRDRRQLKKKFKREEKLNRAIIDEILFKSLGNRSKSLKLNALIHEEMKNDSETDKVAIVN